MYFYLAMVGFEPTPTSTAAPLRSLKKELSWSRFMLDIYSLSIRMVNVYTCTLEVDESAKYSRPSLRKVYLNNSSKHPTVLAQVGNTPQSGSSPSGSQIYQFVERLRHKTLYLGQSCSTNRVYFYKEHVPQSLFLQRRCI